MVPGRNRTVGDRAERFAKEYLQGKGLRPVAQNFQCRMGEIDLVMRDSDCLVFVEVRFRSARRMTSAAFTVDARKRRKLIRAAAQFLATDRRYADAVTRFDIVGIDENANGRRRLRWVRDAFRPADSSL